MIAEIAFEVRLTAEEPSLADLGIAVLTLGIVSLGRSSGWKRAKFVTLGGGIGGAVFVLVGHLQFDGLIYLGITVMVATGIVLFVTRSNPEQRRNAEAL